MFMRGLVQQRAAFQAPLFGTVASRGFRTEFKNPYKYDPTQISEYERQAQSEKPVWERVFDYKKYMEHDGPLKVWLSSPSRTY